MKIASIKEDLIGDLDYLETMVKGSLQIMTDGVEHENTSKIDLANNVGGNFKKRRNTWLPIKIDFKEQLQ